MSGTFKLQLLFQKAHGGVGQDKSVPLINRSRSTQPYRGSKGGQSTHDNALVPFTTQLKRFVKAEIHRIAKENKISDSAAGSALLERMIQHNADMQYGALLEPIIKNEIKKDISSYSNRNANLAIHAYYEAAEAKILLRKFLSFYLKDAELQHLVTEARKEAGANLSRRMEEK